MLNTCYNINVQKSKICGVVLNKLYNGLQYQGVLWISYIMVRNIKECFEDMHNINVEKSKIWGVVSNKLYNGSKYQPVLWIIICRCSSTLSSIDMVEFQMIS